MGLRLQNQRDGYIAGSTRTATRINEVYPGMAFLAEATVSVIFDNEEITICL
jgi:hypothetical protein